MQKTPFETQVEDAAQKAGGLLRSRYGLWTLGFISFVESALPAPLVTDPFLVAYVLVKRAAVWRGLIVTLLTSVLGGLFAYAAAFWFYDTLAAPYLQGAAAEQFFSIAERFQEGTFLMTILGAVTPIPYTFVALAAGFVKADVLAFIAASLLGRGFRYGVLAWLSYRYGQQALALARRQLLLVSVLLFAVAIIYFYLKF